MDLDTLIQRAKEKDPDALDTIYRTYYPQMVGTCMNIIREDRAVVDDLVHEHIKVVRYKDGHTVQSKVCVR